MPKTQKHYTDLLQTLRRYVSGFSPADGYDLRHPLTPAQKRRITVSAEALRALTSRPAKVYRPRDTRRLRVAQSESHGGIKIKGLKVAFVPVAQPTEPAKISITKSGKMRVTQRGVTRVRINIDPVALARDPIRAVNEAIKHSSAVRFGIQAGDVHRVETNGALRNGIHAFNDRANIGPAVARLVERYGSDTYNPNDKNSHHYKNWLFGVIAHEFESFEDHRAYQAAFERQRELIKRSTFVKRLARLSKAKKAAKKRRK